MCECVWSKLCLTMLFLVHILQALSFWTAVTPLSLILLALIQGLIKENAYSRTCLIWGRYMNARFPNESFTSTSIIPMIP